MFSLIYLSTATTPFTVEQLKQLLDWSRNKNAKLQITGLLLYKDGNFMQMLEGDEPIVHELYTSIWRDPRHRNVNIIAEMQTTGRQFPDWSMGFKNLESKEVASLPGYSDFLDKPLEKSTFPSVGEALRLFQTFKSL